MSRVSDIRHHRKIKRSVGKKRDERLDRFFRSVQRNAMDTTMSLSERKLLMADMNKPVVFHLEAPYTPEFLRLRAKDLARLGLTVSVVPNTPEVSIQDKLVELCKQPACFSWPKVSEEEVARVAERLRSTVPVHFTDPHIANFNGDEESNEERVRESMKAWLNENVPIERKPDAEQ